MSSCSRKTIYILVIPYPASENMQDVTIDSFAYISIVRGGWPKMVMVKEVDGLARKTPRKRSHVIDAFSLALIAIPPTIAENIGLDSAELVA
ncbi:hypothetical protein QYF36_024839 [Acer negundo]|nr:hypothetical protein QYF36_024839 [Acer negundo]